VLQNFFKVDPNDRHEIPRHKWETRSVLLFANLVLQISRLAFALFFSWSASEVILGFNDWCIMLTSSLGNPIFLVQSEYWKYSGTRTGIPRFFLTHHQIEGHKG
jgi:hypothetical protein